VLAALPLFHAYGLTLCLGYAVATAATLVLLPRFDAREALATVRRTGTTFVPGVPTMFARLAEAAEQQGVDLPSVRYGFSGAAPLPPDVAALWERLSGGVLVEGYGMTESSPVTVGNPASPARRLGTIGVPLPSTEARVVDPEVPSAVRRPGEAGELLVRGPQVFDGYADADQESDAVLLPGGWLRTGDVVVMSGDGYLTLVDRLKEVVLVGGFTVYPSEVEEILREHPDVADAAVVGVAGDDGAERVAAAVVAAPGRRPDPGELRAWARGQLAGYQTPTVVRVVDSLPRDVVGKLRRREAARLLGTG
jgi:long-chain acyl-CoA synthetase